MISSNRLSALLPAFLTLILVIGLTSCEEKVEVPKDQVDNPTDTTDQNQPPDTVGYDTITHKLLEVITSDNYWGGLVITEVDRVMTLLKTTKYTLSNYITDVEGGRLEVDCSKYVETIIKMVSEIHYSEFPKSSSSGMTALAKDYYNYFITLPEEPDGVHSWIRIMNLEDARPGDLIAYIHEEEGSTTGHVMIICSFPEPSTFSPVDMRVVVNDAANSGHFEDTRNNEGPYSSDYQYIAQMYFDDGTFKFSGVGIGSIWFYLGGNSYYRWSSPDGTKVYKNMAIGRMVDIHYSSIY